MSISKRTNMKNILPIVTFISWYATVGGLDASQLQKGSIVEKCRHAALWTIVPDERQCRKFYICDGRGQYEEFTCAANYHFSAKYQRCEPGTCQDAAAAKVCEVNSVHRVASDCTRYLHCENGSRLEVINCDSGRYFYAGVRSCLPVAVTPEHHCSCMLPQNSTFSNTYDCETYYRCIDGVAVLVQCPPQHYYEASDGSCKLDTTGVCLVSPTMPPAVASEALALQQCTKTGRLLVPHSDNCSHFYACAGRRAIRMSCPVDHYFDAERLSCRQGTHSNCKVKKIELDIHEQSHNQAATPSQVHVVHVKESAVGRPEQAASSVIQLDIDLILEAAKQHSQAIEAEHNYDKLSSKFILA